MDSTWIHDYDVEPDYMVIRERDKKKILNKLLILPIIVILILSMLLVGEMLPASGIPSVTRMRYLLKTQEILNELMDGNSEEIVGHTLLYFDNGNVKYNIAEGIPVIYQHVTQTLDDAINVIKDSKKSALVARVDYVQNNYYYQHSGTSVQNAGHWRTIGLLMVDGQDIATILIDFYNMDTYYVTIDTYAPVQNDLTDEEYEELLSTIQSSDAYIAWGKIGRELEWFKNILGNQDDNLILINKLLKSNHKTKESIETIFTSKFISTYQSSNYTKNFAQELLKLSTEYTVQDLTINHMEYEKTLGCIVSKIYIKIADINGFNGTISAQCLNTYNGYKIVPHSVELVNDVGFDESQAKIFVKNMNNGFF